MTIEERYEVGCEYLVTWLDDEAEDIYYIKVKDITSTRLTTSYIHLPTGDIGSWNPHLSNPAADYSLFLKLDQPFNSTNYPEYFI